MYMTILLFGFFGISMGTGWVAQLLTGRRSGRIEWGQAFWVGLAGMGIAWLVAWLLDRTGGTPFAVAGVVGGVAARGPRAPRAGPPFPGGGCVGATAAAVLTQPVPTARDPPVQAEEHHRDKE